MPLRLSEPLGIDPTVDVVFHKLFADPANEPVLRHFLNAVLALPVPIVAVQVQNPFQPHTWSGQRGLIIDVRATDSTGRIYQIEMQRRVDLALPQRILYGWARIYGEQLRQGAPYQRLKPVISLWVCRQDLFPDSAKAHLRYTFREVSDGSLLHPDAQIDVLQLQRWARGRDALLATPLGAWFWFFNEAPRWTEVPKPIQTPIMEHAMATLHSFRRDVQLNDLYRGRIEAERMERTTQLALEEAWAEAERERAEKERERAEKEHALAATAQALAERARDQAQKVQLRALLRAAGITLPPDLDDEG